MRLTLRKFGFLILAIYLLFTCYTSYILLSRKWNNFFYGASRYLKNSSKTHYDEKLRDYKFGPKPLALPRPNEDNNNNSISNDNNRYNFESLVRQKLGAKTSSSPAPLNLPPQHHQPHSSKEAIVEIWGKAAIGLFLWALVWRGQCCVFRSVRGPRGQGSLYLFTYYFISCPIIPNVLSKRLTVGLWIVWL